MENIQKITELAHQYYSDQHEKYTMDFDHTECIQEIHAMFGREIAKEVNNEIVTDIPELGIELIK